MGKPMRGEPKRALGLMSGTSMDGIDLALIETDGQEHVRRLATASVDYPRAFRNRLREVVADACALSDRKARPGRLAGVERELTDRHADAVLAFLGNHALQPFAVDCIGFHGQTVLHRPERHLTVQLGDGKLLAEKTGIDVVYDLRAADCQAGGQGAPLVPVYHRALTVRLRECPVAVLNIGGVANVTWIGRGGQLIAFDTGPGNALIDDWMLQRRGAARDDNGAAALAGRVDEDVLRHFLANSYFGAPPPKSLDRNAFALELARELSDEDGAATLAAFTAEAAARAREHMPEEPQVWIVTGGGRKNRAIMTVLAGRVHHAVVPAEAAGLDGDAMEAEAWAYLAVRSLLGLPITFPGTTGAPRAMTGGVLAKAPHGKQR
jgi:anhydro-N-acetylmuramic acid kinase